MLIFWQMKSHCGRCCNHFIGWLADVTAKVADGIANLVDASVIAIVADGMAT